MTHRRLPIAAVTAASLLALGAAASADPAHTANVAPRAEIRSPAYVDNQPNYTDRSYAENPAQYQGRMEALMNQQVQRVASEVQRGTLPRQALVDAQQDRLHVEANIRSAARDGVITRGEDRAIESMARGIGEADHGYGVAAPVYTRPDRWQPINH